MNPETPAMSLADELEKLAGEAADLSLPLYERAKTGNRLYAVLRDNIPAIVSALREREAVVAWLHHSAAGLDNSEWDIDWPIADHLREIAEAIEEGQHMKGEGE